MTDIFILGLVDDAGKLTGNNIYLPVQQICLVESITSNTSGQTDVTLDDGSVYTVVTPKDENSIPQSSLISAGGFQATLPSGGNCWIRGAVTAVIPASEALKVKGSKPVSGATRIYGVGFGYIDVTESLAVVLYGIGVPRSQPKPPTNLTYVLNGDGSVTLTWVLPTEDIYGGTAGVDIFAVYAIDNGIQIASIDGAYTTLTTAPLPTATAHS